jgi:hypothetical protein
VRANDSTQVGKATRAHKFSKKYVFENEEFYLSSTIRKKR